MFRDIVKEVRKLHPEGGTVLEFGVGSGKSTAVIAAEIVTGWNCKLLGFDSFQGLPEEAEHVHSIRLPSGRLKYVPGGWVWPKSDVEKKLSRYTSLPDERFEIIGGWFRDTLTGELQKSIDNLIFVHVDVDLYISTVELLDFVTPLLQRGTVICFNDWGQQIECGKLLDSRTVGEGLAFTEWEKKNSRVRYDMVLRNNDRQCMVTIQ
jgi:predicted O-methyltransferase YrrM